MKWKTILALMVIYLAVALNWNWPWGVLFILWTVPALATGRTHLVEPVDRKEHPILFWLIVGTWILLSLLMIGVDLQRLY